MTKAELIAAIADAPDDAEVYRDNGYGILMSVKELHVFTESYGVVISLEFEESTHDDDEEEAA